MNTRKPIFYVALSGLMVACGGASKIASLPLETLDGKTIPSQSASPSKEELKSWPHQDLLTTGYPGISLEKAYKVLEGRKAKTVIVGVVDSGVDINHEDLKSIIWTNPKEIPNNGIDDDKNGYVDDVHGWNFLGEINQDNLEYVRILKSGDTNNPDYKRAEKTYKKEYQESQEGIERLTQIKEKISMSDALIQSHLAKKEYTLEDFSKRVQVKILVSDKEKTELSDYKEVAFKQVTTWNNTVTIEDVDLDKYDLVKVRYQEAHTNQETDSYKLANDYPVFSYLGGNYQDDKASFKKSENIIKVYLKKTKSVSDGASIAKPRTRRATQNRAADDGNNAASLLPVVPRSIVSN